MFINSTGNVEITAGDLKVNGSTEITGNSVVNGSLTADGTLLTSTTIGALNNLTLGQSENNKVITQDNSGTINIGKTGENQIIDIKSHNGTDSGLKLGGNLVTASADELNMVSAIVPGTASSGKAVVIDNNSDISGINSVTLTGSDADSINSAKLNVSCQNISRYDK